jgi:hypothetical protein
MAGLARSGLFGTPKFRRFAPSLRENMLLDLFVDIVGSIAEKRYPAVRKTIRWSGAVLLGALTLYVGYAFLAA